MKENRELTAAQAAFYVNPEDLPSPQKKDSPWEVIGQPRALQALKMGTRLQSRGYNIFLSGQSGTGKRTAIENILKQHPRTIDKLRDVVFTYNFALPERPKALTFPPGEAKEFKKYLHTLLENLKEMIRRRLAGEGFKEQRDNLLSSTEREENHLVTEFEKRLNDNGFTIVQVEGEEEGEQTADIAPIYNDEITDFDDLQQMVADGEMTEEEWNNQRQRYYRYMDEMKTIFSRIRKMHLEMTEKMDALQQEAVQEELSLELQGLNEAFPDARGLEKYREEMEKDILNNLHLFTEEDPLDDEDNPPQLRYGANVLVDNTGAEKAPVIFENHPTYSNLFGTVESRFEVGGESRTNFMMIRPGSVIRASGGFLILNIEDLLKEDETWAGLKRVLNTGSQEIQAPVSPLTLTGNTLKPEAVPVDVKVIIMAPEGLYDLLCQQDRDFQKHFKIPAEFDSLMPYQEETLQAYINFIHKNTKNQGRLPLTREAQAAVVEQGVRIAGRKDRLSTQFSRIADLLLEGEDAARQENPKAARVEDRHIRQAVQQRIYLHSLPEEKIYTEILGGNIRIATEGSARGQVNGLAVLDRGYYAFGCPMLITCQVAPGDRGIINIEREAGLSGELHDKGMLIIEGFVRSRYTRDFPLSINASLCFEQSYSDIDGDSASSAEVYALLSALSGLPLRQDLAVTGSVNQMGQIQAVGGVTEKVEGFFRICRERGLTGNQGVIIPAQNVNNLILSEEIIQPIKEGLFHVYPVETVDEGMALLTGREPGIAGKEGNFPPETVNGRTAERLKKLSVKNKDS